MTLNNRTLAAAKPQSYEVLEQSSRWSPNPCVPHVSPPAQPQAKGANVWLTRSTTWTLGREVGTRHLEDRIFYYEHIQSALYV